MSAPRPLNCSKCNDVTLHKALRCMRCKTLHPAATGTTDLTHYAGKPVRGRTKCRIPERL